MLKNQFFERRNLAPNWRRKSSEHVTGTIINNVWAGKKEQKKKLSQKIEENKNERRNKIDKG